jgi:hypothetical protein
MPYQIETHEDINTLISHISSVRPTDDELTDYLEALIRFQNRMLQNNAKHIYHILVMESYNYNLVDSLSTMRSVQQNKTFNAARKQINMMTILVGKIPKALQIMIAMIRSSGRRQVAVFPTLEAALAFVRTDSTNYREPVSDEGRLSP